MYLNEKTKSHIERVVGKPFSEIAKMDLKEEVSHVEKRTRKPLIFSHKFDHRMIGRGSPPIATGRFFTMEEVDKRLGELK